MSTCVIGVFDNAQEAQQAASDLRSGQFANCQIRTDMSADELTNLGVSSNDLDTYRQCLRRGGTIVSLQAPDEATAKRAGEILDREGAIDVDQLSEGMRTAPEGTTLHQIRERLFVGKEVVDNGGVRVRTYITERPIDQAVTLREEKIDVRREPVDKPADPQMLDNAQERTIEVSATKEVPVVQKEARVTEEVSVSKTANERTEQVGQTLREQHVDVQPLQDQTQTLGEFDEAYWHSDYDRNYGATAGASWDAYRPAYRYGWTVANDPGYRGREWNDVEPDLRSRWERDHPNSWDRFKMAIRSAWDRTVHAGARTTTPGGGIAYADNPPRTDTARNDDAEMGTGTETKAEDQRGIFEKIADAITGDDVDDKTGKGVVD